MLVSMIIPVYNVEKYLRRCLTSVAQQTYKELEVIIVNDGSPDHSQDIIDEFCKDRENFFSYITENNGLGGARNYGLGKAHGEYVCFLDSDDYIADTFVEALAKRAMHDGSDIVVCNNIDVFENTNTQVVQKAIYDKNPVSLKENKEILFNRVCAWAKLYRKCLFDDLGYEARVWYEDMRLTPKLYDKANQISYIDEALLYYVIRDGSIMTSANAKRNLEIIDAFEDLRQYFKQQGSYDEIKEQLEFLMLDHILISAITRVILTKDVDKKKIIKTMKDYVDSYQGIEKNSYLVTMPRNRRIIYFCNRHGLYTITKFIFKMKHHIQD